MGIQRKMQSTEETNRRQKNKKKDVNLSTLIIKLEEFSTAVTRQIFQLSWHLKEGSLPRQENKIYAFIAAVFVIAAVIEDVTTCA